MTGQHLPVLRSPLRYPPRSSRTPASPAFPAGLKIHCRGANSVLFADNAARQWIITIPSAPGLRSPEAAKPACRHPMTVTPSGTLPTVTEEPGVPVATVTGVTVLALVLTTQAVAPPGAKPTA